MHEFLNIILCAVIIILGGLCVKIWSSLDKFFEEKAKNYATKQDITEITKMTETVQAKFQKILGKFDADLKFKYQFYENQYSKVYSKLYQKICESEAIRFTEVYLKDQCLEFKEVPIVDYAKDDTVEDNCAVYDSIKSEITKLIFEQHMYVSPELMKLVCAFDIMEKCGSSVSIEDKIQEMERTLWVNIVKTILKDYSWVRQQLHLQDSKDQIELLERGEFISFIQT